MGEDLGTVFVKKLAEFWCVLPDQVIWRHDGFDWWPGEHRLSIRVSQGVTIAGELNYKVSISTAFLECVESNHPMLPVVLYLLMTQAPSYSVDHLSPTFREALGVGPGARPLSFISTVYIREDNASWMPRFIAGMTILQVYDAQRLAERFGKELDTKPALSGPHGQLLQEQSEALSLLEQFYLPAGQDTNRWIGTGEFLAIAEGLPADRFFVNADDSGLALELAFGARTALIQLHTDQPHPQLGSGLLATLKLPKLVDDILFTEEPTKYTQLEALGETCVPLLGSWTAVEVESGESVLAFGSFTPNLLYQPGLALNQVLWMIGRAQWVKSTMFPDLPEFSLAEILEKRFEPPTQPR